MFTTRFGKRIAAAALTAALTLVGLAGVGVADIDGPNGDVPAEEAGATWSFTGSSKGGGGASTQGATWS